MITVLNFSIIILAVFFNDNFILKWDKINILCLYMRARARSNQVIQGKNDAE